MLKIGFHVSISGGIDKAVNRARKLNCETFQIFTRNPRSWSSRGLRDEEIRLFKERLGETKIYPVFSHMPYILNLSSPDKEVYERSIDSLKEEIQRCKKLEIKYIVTHLGSHLGTGEEEAIDRVINALNRALSENTSKVEILLENTAGSENQIGSKLDDFVKIFKGLSDENFGLCFDTCHAYAAGIELHSARGIKRTLEDLDNIGFSRLKLIHLNDSIGKSGSHYDKHQHIGLGEIGEEGFKKILSSRLVKDTPIILETPQDDIRSDRDNMRYVKQLIKDY